MEPGSIDFLQNLKAMEKIPFWAVEKTERLRRKGFLPNFPEFVTINIHRELALCLNTSLSLRKLVKLFENLKRPDEKPAEIQPLSETLDFYVLYPQDYLTQRIRFLFKSGEVQSVRVILADVKPQKKIYWKFKKTLITARPECVFIALTGKPPNVSENEKEILNAGKNFFSSHQLIGAMVYKKVVKINLGRDERRERKAVYQGKNGKIVSITQKRHILGTAPYVDLAIQKVKIATFTKPQNSKKVLALVENVIQRKLKPKDCFAELSQTRRKFVSRVEFEYKDYRQITYLMRQLIKILKGKKIDYTIEPERKISINSLPKVSNRFSLPDPDD
ncbi:MAG TPA: hypothetical protein VMW41_01480 [Candidatus Bathyarchaeia archaeon]|nr:hypothetical protein [Candidatus Bathyarchaeia archaeon]